VSRRALRAEAVRRLAEAGVASPHADAEILLAHVLGVDRGALMLVDEVGDEHATAYAALVARRAAREPLQHLTGLAAFRHVELSVGPGVFVPRPETELLAGWAIEEARRVLGTGRAPVVVDLCTGSGALALAVANARPDAVVYAGDIDPQALAWARHNADVHADAGNTPIRLYSGDIGDPTMFAELDGLVDLVLCNPPYVPEGTPVPPEVAEHDPPRAVFAEESGLAVIRHAIAAGARLLRPGGGLAIEHDDTHGSAVPALVRARRVLTGVEDHADLTGRARFVTARRLG
jgi:release factor glutamine methyltransferase